MPSGAAYRSCGSPALRPRGPADQVKDIRTGEQVDADAHDWTPPIEDLRPQVITRRDNKEQNP